MFGVRRAKNAETCDMFASSGGAQHDILHGSPDPPNILTQAECKIHILHRGLQLKQLKPTINCRL